MAEKRKKENKEKKDPIDEALDMIMDYEKDLPPRSREEDM